MYHSHIALLLRSWIHYLFLWQFITNDVTMVEGRCWSVQLCFITRNAPPAPSGHANLNHCNISWWAANNSLRWVTLLSVFWRLLVSWQCNVFMFSGGLQQDLIAYVACSQPNFQLLFSRVSKIYWPDAWSLGPLRVSHEFYCCLVIAGWPPRNNEYYYLASTLCQWCVNALAAGLLLHCWSMLLVDFNHQLTWMPCKCPLELTHAVKYRGNKKLIPCHNQVLE